ncbi:serine/threonine-protein kinase 4-like [Coccinella septempunctata]|uniref:serine/threonine-protein kinase 4-like n=1 Tax=Coccinella septempunctata TaxID=41139 RepID=UPI001D07B1A0|nr:serine/threonine-protein kinase 4-like [Coccinella septempunctata]
MPEVLHRLAAPPLGWRNFEAFLGEGGFGRVYSDSARERCQEGQRRSVKEVRLDPEAAREAELMDLFDHRNVLPLIKTLVEPPYLYFALALYEEDFGDLPRLRGSEEGPLVLLSDGPPDRSGFGVAEQLAPCRPLLNELAGTPMYWSPEQLRREPYDTAVDLWALGLVAMDVGTGRPIAY